MMTKVTLGQNVEGLLDSWRDSNSELYDGETQEDRQKRDKQKYNTKGKSLSPKRMQEMLNCTLLRLHERSWVPAGIDEKTGKQMWQSRPATTLDWLYQTIASIKLARAIIKRKIDSDSEADQRGLDEYTDALQQLRGRRDLFMKRLGFSEQEIKEVKENEVHEERE